MAEGYVLLSVPQFHLDWITFTDISRRLSLQRHCNHCFFSHPVHPLTSSRCQHKDSALCHSSVVKASRWLYIRSCVYSLYEKRLKGKCSARRTQPIYPPLIPSRCTRIHTQCDTVLRSITSSYKPRRTCRRLSTLRYLLLHNCAVDWVQLIQTTT